MESHEVLTAVLDRQSKRVLLEELYERSFPSVARFVRNHGGTLDDAKDIFHDAMIVLYEAKVEDYESVRDETAYVVGISKHLWIRKFKDAAKMVALDDFEMTLALPDPETEPHDHKRWLAVIGSAGKKCLDLLQAFYFDRFSLDEISKSFGFSGTRSATVQKFKCIEKIRDTVKSKSIDYEDLA